MGDKGGRRVGLTNLPPSFTDFLEIWDPQTPGSIRVSSTFRLLKSLQYDKLLVFI